MPTRNCSRGSPTCFGRTAGDSLRSARRAAACATSHSRASTGPFGRWIGPLDFAASTAPTEARDGSLGGVMPDRKSLGWLSGEWFYLLIGEEPIKTALQPGRTDPNAGPACHVPTALGPGCQAPHAHGSDVKAALRGAACPTDTDICYRLYRCYRCYRGSGAHDPARLSRKSRARARALASVVTGVLGSPSMWT